MVYAYTSDNATSPALGNTGITLRKVAYGIALPTIMIAGVINGHVCAKLIYIRVYVHFLGGHNHIIMFCSQFVVNDVFFM